MTILHDDQESREIELAKNPPRRHWRSRPDLWTVILIFIAAELGYYVAGIRWIPSPYNASEGPQVLGYTFFSHDFWQSLYYLHEQPPLFNIEYAFFDAFGNHGFSTFLMGITDLGFAFVVCVGTYLCALELRINRWIAVALAGFTIVSPSLILYQWFDYSTIATEATIVTLALCAARYFKGGSTWYAVGLFSCAAALVLGSSTFQLPFLLLLIAFVCWVRRERWRQVIRCAAGPTAVVLLWYVKTAIVFGLFTTSSWLGMNLAHITVEAAPKAEVQRLVRDHLLTPLALIKPFLAPTAYEPQYASAPHTGVAVLDQDTSSFGNVNYNNQAYIPISSAYLHNDLAFIEHDPVAYLQNVWKATKLWFVPSDRYYWLMQRDQISGFANAYDHVVTLESSLWPTAKVGDTQTVGFSEISLSLLLVYLLMMLGVPIVYLFYRRRIRLPYAAAGVIWGTILYVFLATTFLDYGENNRFRADLAMLPVLGAVALLSAIWRSMSGLEVAIVADGGEVDLQVM